MKHKFGEDSRGVQGGCRGRGCRGRGDIEEGLQTDEGVTLVGSARGVGWEFISD